MISHASILDVWKLGDSNFTVNCKKVNRIIEIIIHDTRRECVNCDTILSVFEILEYCIMRNIILFL